MAVAPIGCVADKMGCCSEIYLAEADVGRHVRLLEEEIHLGRDVVCRWCGWAPNPRWRWVMQCRFQEAAEPSVARRRSMLSKATNFPLFGTNPPARNFIQSRLTFSRMSLALAVQRYGLGLRLCSSMYSRMACCNSATL